MKSIAVITLVFLTVIGCTPARDEVRAVVARMTDTAASWEDRCTAEDSLAPKPPQQVLSALLPHVEKGMPPGPIWNSGGREIDKEAPVEWQIFYAVSRSWNHQVNSLPPDEGGALLLKLLQKTSAANARIRLITNLINRWNPNAEAPIAELLKSTNEDLSVRTTCGLALILHGIQDYHRLLLDYAEESNHAERKRWYTLLSDPRYRKRTGIDPRVVHMGFNLLLKEQELSPTYVHAGYFLAIQTGAYTGTEFRPDQKQPKYQGEHGLTDSFFEDTVKNAITWWNDNRAKVEEELPTQ